MAGQTIEKSRRLVGPRLVKDVMTCPDITVEDSARFIDIVRLTQARAISSVPVVDDRGRLLGIVSEDDLVLKQDDSARRAGFFESGGHRADRAKADGKVARQLMTATDATVRSTTSIAAAGRLMHEKKVNCLPVLDSREKVVGVVAQRDLLKVFLRSDAEIRLDVLDRLRSFYPHELEAIEVGAKDGVVTLTGTVVDGKRARFLAGRARSVDGVVRVRSWLLVSGPGEPAGSIPPFTHWEG
jgi:CBS-domain-containing membrane protein